MEDLDCVAVVNDIRLACIVRALDFKPYKGKAYRPLYIKKKDGEIYPCYYFHDTSDCGAYAIEEVVLAFQNPEEFMRDNPEHPASFVMSALLHQDLYEKHMKESPKKVVFRVQDDDGDDASFMVSEGSPQYEVALAEGYSLQV